jgi:hypothetical protein
VEREELTENNFRGSEADLQDPDRFFRSACGEIEGSFMIGDLLEWTFTHRKP